MLWQSQEAAARTDDGPEPIIECNHKMPIVTAAGDISSVNPCGSKTSITSSPPPSAAANPPVVHSQNHGLLVMFQKHLGLGKQIASAFKGGSHHGVTGVSLTSSIII